MIVYYSEYSMFVVGDDVPKWLPKWASQHKTIMSDLRLRNGNFPFQNRKGCELGLYRSITEFRAISFAIRRIMARLAACPTLYFSDGCWSPDWILCARTTVSVLIELWALLRISPILITAGTAFVVISVPLLSVHLGAQCEAQFACGARDLFQA